MVYFCTIKTFFQFSKIRSGQWRTTKQLFFFGLINENMSLHSHTYIDLPNKAHSFFLKPYFFTGPTYYLCISTGMKVSVCGFRLLVMTQRNMPIKSNVNTGTWQLNWEARCQGHPGCCQHDWYNLTHPSSADWECRLAGITRMWLNDIWTQNKAHAGQKES